MADLASDHLHYFQLTGATKGSKVIVSLIAPAFNTPTGDPRHSLSPSLSLSYRRSFVSLLENLITEKEEPASSRRVLFLV